MGSPILWIYSANRQRVQRFWRQLWPGCMSFLGWVCETGFEASAGYKLAVCIASRLYNLLF